MSARPWDQAAARVRHECLLWLDGAGAAATCASPLGAERSGSGLASIVALFAGQCFFIECLADEQVHRRRSHRHQRDRFHVQGARCLSVRSAGELELLVRQHVHSLS